MSPSKRKRWENQLISFEIGKYAKNDLEGGKCQNPKN